jgi:RNA polymerase sigma-70 factor (ECF subfamily)
MRPMNEPASANNSEWVEDLLRRVEPRLLGLFSRYRVPTQDAEDLLQEALLALVAKPDAIRCPESWLLGTLRNRCLLYWRKRRRRLYETVDATILELVASPETPAQERADVSSDLKNLISRLPERCRSIFRLRYGLGCGGSEVAAQLGYQESSIRKVTLRCLSALSRQLTASGLS